MSEQALNLETDWKEVQEAFENHFRSENLENEGEVIEYSRNGEHLKIWRDAST